MKIFFLLTFLAFTPVLISAQFSNDWLGTKNKHLLYSSAELMVGNSSGGNLGMSFVYNSRYSVEFGYSGISNQYNSIPILKSESKSDDADNLIPFELLDNFDVMVGRHFNLNQKKTIRFVLQGGPGISVLRESYYRPSKFSQNNDPAITNKSKELSIKLNSKFEFPIIDLLGFSAGPTLVMNQDRSYLTFCVGIMYGIITTD